MKKRILISILAVLFISIQVNAQVAYHDALILRKYVDADQQLNRSSDSVFIVLDKYIQPGISNTKKQIMDSVNETSTNDPNPFVEISGGTESDINALIKGGLAGPLSSMGELDVTNLADGFAKFLVKRTKEELNAAFFSKFKDLITDPRYKDAQLLFPQTYVLLQAIGTEIYNYEAYLNGLREAFEKDLNTLLPNLKNVIEDGRHKSFFDNHVELKAICLSSIYVGQGLMSKVHPGEILADYPLEYLTSDSLLNARGAVQTLQLFSASIRAKGNSSYWITTRELKNLIQDPIALNLYMGLVYQSAKNGQIHFKGGVKLCDVLAKAKEKIDPVVNYLNGLQRHTNLVVASIHTIEGKESAKVTFQDYYALYNSSLDLFEYAPEVYLIPGLESLKPGEKFNSKIMIARAGGNIALDINRRNYASAIINLYQLYTGTITDPEAKNVKPFILKYGSFMAAVVQAQNADEIAAAIEAVALPSGSSRVKRESAFNVSLNAYVGLFTGYEKIKGVDKSGFKVNSYGITAPVGIAVSRGHSILFAGTGKKNWGWSTSLFISIVDIGALTAFRFSNDTTQTVPNIQLKDIISPGAFLSIGIPKSPISFAIGYQTGPILREVTATINNKYDKSYSRLSISLCVDIPLLNFYTRSFSK